MMNGYTEICWRLPIFCIMDELGWVFLCRQTGQEARKELEDMEQNNGQ